eukprot:CAMPEP_0182519344 /NCGR_PEP_ID=MMETSP1321-20130603/45051_1 /TAXON_ID=91990 /ORGANISM="Bolidomonas sp., Strain RCC1657" /LENGTH=210 /DNA_ID=CAMNT_0024727317 /DNA_START=470 /DNA_END=1102 /DNA_ORIENTATION=-
MATRPSFVLNSLRQPLPKPSGQAALLHCHGHTTKFCAELPRALHGGQAAFLHCHGHTTEYQAVLPRARHGVLAAEHAALVAGECPQQLAGRAARPLEDIVHVRAVEAAGEVANLSPPLLGLAKRRLVLEDFLGVGRPRVARDRDGPGLDLDVAAREVVQHLSSGEHRAEPGDTALGERHCFTGDVGENLKHDLLVLGHDDLEVLRGHVIL